MPTLLLKFWIILEDHGLPINLRNFGPLFHRWLPDGEKQAIVLETGDSNAKLKVWFERHGYVDNGIIRFDYGRREVDPELIPEQAILDAGPLSGLLEIQGLSKNELESVQNKKVGDPSYVALGKKVVKELIYPPVAKFLDILRTNYGQYWIHRIEKWDSRKETLGSYCGSQLQLKWSLDAGKTWERFVPDKPVAKMVLIVQRRFHEYLTEKDWDEFGKVIREGYEPSFAAHILARTHQLFDKGDLKEALVEGVTALEVAVSEFIHERLHGAKFLLDSMSAFKGLPLRAKVITILTSLDKIPYLELENTVKAIDMRNKIVHEGWNPPDKARSQLNGLLNTVAALLPGPKYRFPSANPGNAVMSPEEWEKRDKQKS
jgi:hypothetical protein